MSLAAMYSLPSSPKATFDTGRFKRNRPINFPSYHTIHTYNLGLIRSDRFVGIQLEYDTYMFMIIEGKLGVNLHSIRLAILRLCKYIHTYIHTWVLYFLFRYLVDHKNPARARRE